MISKAIEDSELKEHIASLPHDGREVFLIADESVRLSVVSAPERVNQMRANQGTGILESYLLGQGYIAGALLSSTVKGNDRIQLDIQCGGPIGGISIEAWASGAVRGYLKHNPIPLSKPINSLDTSELYGPGFLTVTKILEGSRTPFSGQIMLEYGNLANDLALLVPSITRVFTGFRHECRRIRGKSIRVIQTAAYSTHPNRILMPLFKGAF